MKRLVSIVVMSMTTAMMGAGAVHAAELNMACAKTGEARYIQVVSPGQVGQACDVRYTRNRGKTISIPYHANNSQSFCDEKAAELIQTLIHAGYVCTPTTAVIIANIGKPVTVAQAPEPEVELQILAQAPAEIAAPSSIPAPAAPTLEPVVAAQATPKIVTPTPIAPKPVTSVQAAPKMPRSSAPEMPILAEAPEDKGVLEGKMNDILADSAPIPASEPPTSEPEEMASHGPAQLTSTLSEPATPIKTASASTSVVGRLLGATPVEPEPVPVEDLQEPLRMATPVANAAIEVASPVQKTDARIANKAGRTVEEIIIATIDAQMAAWNEGSLEAFMGTYWNDDDLKFISGVKMTKGWSSTMKNYRARYSTGAGLGRLTLDKTDVQMVTEDVAVITGRFHHTDGDTQASGAFSLVMRRFDGLWRIVHDHTAQDPVPEE